MNYDKPKGILFAISGKRYSGKDFFSSLLENEIKAYNTIFNTETIRLADELKKLFAMNFGLDLQKLISDRVYKESKREEMTRFYKETSQNDHLIWCRKILEIMKGEKTTENDPKVNVFILSDLRHKFELNFFQEALKSLGFAMVFIRLEVSEITKEKRGWKFIKEIDENITEIDLDDGVSWDFLLKNEESGQDFLLNFIKFEIIPLLKTISS